MVVDPTLFNVSLNYLDDLIDVIFTKFASDTKLSGETDMSERKIHMDRLEQQVSSNCMNFSKYNCKAQHLARPKQKSLYRPGSVWLQSRLAERVHRILMDSQLNVSQQCTTATAKTKGILSCIHRGVARRDRGVIIPFSIYQITFRDCAQF